MASLGTAKDSLPSSALKKDVNEIMLFVPSERDLDKIPPQILISPGKGPF